MTIENFSFERNDSAEEDADYNEGAGKLLSPGDIAKILTEAAEEAKVPVVTQGTYTANKVGDMARILKNKGEVRSMGQRKISTAITYTYDHAAQEKIIRAVIAGRVNNWVKKSELQGTEDAWLAAALKRIGSKS